MSDNQTVSASVDVAKEESAPSNTATAAAAPGTTANSKLMLRGLMALLAVPPLIALLAITHLHSRNLIGLMISVFFGIVCYRICVQQAAKGSRIGAGVAGLIAVTMVPSAMASLFMLFGIDVNAPLPNWPAVLFGTSVPTPVLLARLVSACAWTAVAIVVFERIRLPILGLSIVFGLAALSKSVASLTIDARWLTHLVWCVAIFAAAYGFESTKRDDEESPSFWLWLSGAVVLIMLATGDIGRRGISGLGLAGGTQPELAFGLAGLLALWLCWRAFTTDRIWLFVMGAIPLVAYVVHLNGTYPGVVVGMAILSCGALAWSAFRWRSAESALLALIEKKRKKM